MGVAEAPRDDGFRNRNGWVFVDIGFRSVMELGRVDDIAFGSKP